ncbi:hypothetical protein Mame01_22950 [Microbispora amethystogenes]|nr:hypothetical protein Mame01_22950 [Microbispora amethystogenes]
MGKAAGGAAAAPRASTVIPHANPISPTAANPGPVIRANLGGAEVSAREGGRGNGRFGSGATRVDVHRGDTPEGFSEHGVKPQESPSGHATERGRDAAEVHRPPLREQLCRGSHGHDSTFRLDICHTLSDG